MATDSGGQAGKPGLIGKGIRITGMLRGGEDLVIEGRIEGSIALEDNHLVLERSAIIKANAEVKNITVRGVMNGNSSATEKVELCEEAQVEGDIKAPRLVMREGAKFRGNVDMEVPLPEGLEPLAPAEPEFAHDAGADAGEVAGDDEGLDDQW